METRDYRLLYEREKQIRLNAEARAEAAERKLELIREYMKDINTEITHAAEIAERLRKQIMSD